MKEEEKIKDLKAVYSGAVQADKIELANMIKGGIDLIEKLQKENDELKFEERSRRIGKYGDAEIHDVINRTLSNDYISVKKIKDKIENLKKVKERNIKRDFDTVYKDGYFTGGIDALQELLESEE